MVDREKVISTLEEIKTQTAGIGLDSAVIAHKFIDKILALLNEQEHKDRMFHALEDDWKRLKELLKEQGKKQITVHKKHVITWSQNDEFSMRKLYEAICETLLDEGELIIAQTDDHKAEFVFYVAESR